MKPRIRGEQYLVIIDNDGVSNIYLHRKCLKEGRDVTSCSMEFFRKVKAMCATEFMTYATCLERGSPNMEFSHCRNTQVTILQSY